MQLAGEELRLARAVQLAQVEDLHGVRLFAALVASFSAAAASFAALAAASCGPVDDAKGALAQLVPQTVALAVDDGHRFGRQI